MVFRHQGGHESAFGLALCLLILSSGRLPAATEFVAAHYAGAGWDGHVVLGSWSTVSYECEIIEPGAYRLDVTATDPDGNLATYRGQEVACEPGHRTLTGRFQLGRQDGVVTARIIHNDKQWRELTLPRVGDEALPLFPHTQAERLIVTVGLPDSVQALFEPPMTGRRTVVHRSLEDGLPEDDLAYDSVAALLIAGSQLPSEAQSAAIHRWVQRGGRLIISVGLPPKDFREASLVQGLPVAVDAEPIFTRELTSLESYAGKTVRILPIGVRLPIPKLTFPFGKSLAGARGDLVLIQVPHGMGSVTVLGLDLTQSPLTNWPGVGELVRKMTATGEFAPAATGRKQQFGSTGITEMASQIAASLEHFEAVSRTSPWWVLGGMILVMAVIGPLDYWLVDRVWKRPLSTWVSFPVILAACAGAGFWTAGRTNGDRQRLNQLDIVDVDVETGFTRGSHWATFYSPVSRADQLRLTPVWPAWSASDAKTATNHVGWMGLPEASFGGMYRSGAGTLQFGQADYELEPASGEIRRLPMAQWSTVALSASSEGSLSGMADTNLTSSAAGKLSGTIVHRLPGPLTDWMLSYAGRVYRQPVGNSGGEGVVPLTPKVTWRVDQPSVIQRELRGYLTRTTAREVEHQKDKKIVLQQASYDSLSRDLATILPILSFHAEAGGTAYTGLTNEMLSDHDLTPLIDLDRAVLFGYLDQPAAEAHGSAGPLASSRRTTLVRLILPVDRSKQTFRELPKPDLK